MTSSLDLRQNAHRRTGDDGGMAHLPSPHPARIDAILVVAPTDALQASLRFLLEEESYLVTTVASMDEAAALPAAFACAVIDHHALKAGRSRESGAFVELNCPVVLLANGPPGMTLPQAFRVVTKPLLGPALSQAVREAVSQPATR